MDSYSRNPMFRFLLVLTVASTLGLQGWRTLFNNFAVDVAGLGGGHVGIIQSVREIPGFLALLVVYVLLILREHRLAALSVLTVGLGVMLTGLFPSYGGLLATTLLMSFGFHYYETTNQSLTLQHFDRERSPLVLGKLKSVSAASNIAVGAAIFLLDPLLSFGSLYLIMGGVVVLCGLWGVRFETGRTDAVPQRKRMVFRWRYWLFYFLTFMSGARRQIFVVFAVFLLVEKFRFSVRDVTVLFVINNVVNYFLSPVIGRSIVRFGERKVLSLEYFSLIAVFVAYALVDSRLAAAALYILDHVFFNFSIAIRTYFQKIADPGDIAPSMAVGFTINHVAAVVLPFIGGLLWTVDYRIPFLMGAFLAAVSLLAVQCIGVRAQTQPYSEPRKKA